MISYNLQPCTANTLAPISICILSICTHWPNTVRGVFASVGQKCSFADKAVGTCEELSNCLNTGGVVRRNGSFVRCHGAASAVHFCCRRPKLVAQKREWSNYNSWTICIWMLVIFYTLNNFRLHVLIILICYFSLLVLLICLLFPRAR